MNDHEQHDPQLSAGARALIDEVRDLDGPGADDRARVKRALMATLASGAGLAATTVASNTAAAGTLAGTTAAATGMSLAMKVTAVAVVVAAIGGTALVATQPDEVAPPAERVVGAAPFAEPEPIRPRVAPPRVTSDAPAPPDVAPATTRDEPPMEEAAEDGSPAAEPTSTPRARRVATTRREIAVADSTLTEEIVMIRRAQRALQAGDAEAALRYLDDHASRFSGGVLAEEREAARVLALCRAGQPERSRALAQRFLRDRPASPLRARVLGACPEP